MGFSDQDLSAGISEIWSKKTEMIFDNICVMVPLVSRQFEKDAQLGDTVHVQKPGNFTTQDYVRNNPLELQQATLTDDTLLINQQKYIYFGVDNVDKRQSGLDYMSIYTERAATALRNTVDARLLSHYTDALAANVQGSVGSPIVLSADNIFDYFCEAGEDLDNQSVIGGKRHAVIPPAIRKLITQSPEVRDRGTELVDTNVRNGFFGKFAGFEVHVTTNMARVSNTSPLLFFEQNFINMADQMTKTKLEQPDGYFIDAAAMLKVYGTKVFNPEAGAVIYAA
jgi:hypothetical protein